MMTKTQKKVDYHIAIWGLIAIALAAVIGGWIPMLSASAGAVLGMLNWIVFRHLTHRMTMAGGGLGLGLFLALKFAAIMAIVTLFFLYTPIRPLPFTGGISSLFLGITSYYLVYLFERNTTIPGGDD